MTTIGETIRSTIERMKARAEDPAFQARLQQLEAEAAESAAVRAETERLRFLATSGIPRIAWAQLDQPKETEALAAVRELVAGTGPQLVVLGGPAGRGKTTALAWAAYARRGRFVEAQDLFRLSAFAASDWLELEEAPLLALDEVGSEFLGDVLAANFFSVLNARLQGLRPTVLATNLSLADFRARFLRGPLERLDDRLRAHGRWVSLPGPSMRQHWSEQ